MFILVVFPVDTCYEGGIQLSNGSGFDYPDGYGEASGRVEICVNGEFVDVCPGSVDLQEVCSNMGYAGNCVISWW